MTPTETTTIRTTRKALGLTQAEFAEIAGISRVYLGQIERGDVVPSGATARLLGVVDIPGVVDRLRHMTAAEPSSGP